MTPGALLLVLLLALSGCARVQAILSPPRQPAPATSAPTPPPAAALDLSIPGSPPPVAAPKPSVRATPTPVVSIPAPTIPLPAIPAPPPEPVLAPSPPPPPSAALTPEISGDEARRLREEVLRKLEETDRVLQRLLGRLLKPVERETLLLAQSFLEQARKALAVQEYERAVNLATKARTLTDDLAATVK